MKKQSFLRGSAVLLVMVLITKSLGLIYKIPLTSMLGGSGMSVYSGAFAVFTPVFALVAGGIPSAMSKLVSEQLAVGRYQNAVRIKNTAMAIFSLSAILLTVGLILLSQPLAESIIHIPNAKWAVIAIALSLLPAAVMNVARGWAEGLGSMTPTAASEIFETCGKLIFGLLAPAAVLYYTKISFERYHGCFGKYCSDINQANLTALPFAAAASALGVSVASLFACVFLIIRTKKLSHDYARELQSNGLPKNLRISIAIKRLLQSAVPASLICGTATLSSMVDLLTITPAITKAVDNDNLLFAFLDAYGIKSNERASFVYGSYTGLALTIFGLVPTFTAMLGKSVLPTLTSAFTCQDKVEVKKSISSVLLLSSAISLPSGVGIFLLSTPILNLFFGGSAAEIAICAKPLAILGIAVIFMGISQPCLTALQACNKQVSAVVITLCGTLMKLVLNFVLIRQPSINISGAALSTAISQAFVCAATVIVLIRAAECEKDVLRSIYVCLLPALLCGCAAFLTQNLLVSKLDGLLLRVGVLISISIGAIICLISFILLCISPKKQIKSNFLKKMGKNT